MRKTKKLVKTKRAVCALTAGILAAGMIMPAFAQDEAIAPKSADYGYYVDNYKKNGESGVKDTIDNPAIQCLMMQKDGAVLIFLKHQMVMAHLIQI